MTGGFRHYYLMPDGEIEIEQGASRSDCIPYIIQHGTQDVLCVIEGDAFHSFDISPAGLARLNEECARRLRQIVNGAV